MKTKTKFSNKKNKKVLLKIIVLLATTLLISQLLLNIASCQVSEIRILGVHQTQSKELSITQDIKKLGYYPDYNFQPEEGYKVKIVDLQSNELFSVKFQNPSLIYYHKYEDMNITGGLRIFNETDFALILPSYNKEDRIIILDEKNNEVLSYTTKQITNNKDSNLTSFIITLGAVIFAAILIFFLAKRIHKKTAK